MGSNMVNIFFINKNDYNYCHFCYSVVINFGIVIDKNIVVCNECVEAIEVNGRQLGDI